MSRSLIQDAPNPDQPDGLDPLIQAQFDFLNFSVEKLEAKVTGKLTGND